MLAPLKRPAIAIVGKGRLGTALAKHLGVAGYPVGEISSHPKRQARASLGWDLVWFCVPDAQIRKSASGLVARNWRGKVAVHSSGVLPASALEELRRRGASIASVHPLMTFVKNAVPDLQRVPFAIEGDRRAARVAGRIVRDLGGEVFRVKPRDKAAYHVFATMVCPLLVALLSSAEAVAGLAGISQSRARRRMMPIIRQTLANYQKLGAARSSSGPILRGDVDTIRLHLEALAAVPRTKQVYLALARAALDGLSGATARKVEALLEQASPERAGRNRKGTDRASRRSAHRT